MPFEVERTHYKQKAETFFVTRTPTSVKYGSCFCFMQKEEKGMEANVWLNLYELKLMFSLKNVPRIAITGFSMNILCTGDKLPLERGFFKNSTIDLLLALRFLGGLYNFCNFAIMVSLI